MNIDQKQANQKTPKDKYIIITPNGTMRGPARGSERKAWIAMFRNDDEFEHKVASARARGYHVRKLAGNMNGKST